MDMQMWHGLAGRLLVIKTNVKAFWRVLFFNGSFGLLDGSSQGGLFCSGDIKPARDVPVGDEQGVSRVEWIGVPYTLHQPGAEKDSALFKVAKGAVAVVG